jgi:hypothetical protein
MFDTLTQDELHQLDHKLHNGGHACFEVGNTLAHVANERRAAGHGTLNDETDAAMWDERERWCGAMTELHQLAAEVRAIAAARRTDTANA